MTSATPSENQTNRVAIIGAGFSGLTLGWALHRLGVVVDIYDKRSRPGGLIQTLQAPMLAETAANSILSSPAIEMLMDDLELQPETAGYKSNKRWIYRSRPKQIPLNAFEILAATCRFLINRVRGTHRPQNSETLDQWGQRVLGIKAVQYLLSPAVQGVYAVSAEKLSAMLVLGFIFNRKGSKPKTKFRGSLSFKGGLQSLIDALTNRLTKADARFYENTEASLEALQSKYRAVVVATDLRAAGEILKNAVPRLSEQILNLPRVDVASVNVAFPQTRPLKGFGSLFPADQKFHSLGVLFNSDIFYGRDVLKYEQQQKTSSIENETWILPDVLSDDAQLIKKIEEDRQKLLLVRHQPIHAHINRWPQGLPLYGIQLEKWLQDRHQLNSTEYGHRVTEASYPLYLTGNYLGSIGLTRILDYNLKLATRIQKENYEIPRP